jgi:hypothetical protein
MKQVRPLLNGSGGMGLATKERQVMEWPLTTFPIYNAVMFGEEAMGGSWRRTQRILGKAVRSALIFICHAALACLIVLGVWAVDELIHALGKGEIMLFGRVPLSWLFQAIDAAMIGLFGIAGLIEAAKELIFDGSSNDD